MTPHRPLQILLVEDNPINQKVASLLLQKQGHSVIIAGNGREALTRLDSGHEVDLVLMDVQMPEMDGLQATAVIREREQGSPRRLPIVALTAHALQGDRERCLEAGMDDYVTKPIELPVLLRTIDGVLRRGA